MQGVNNSDSTVDAWIQGADGRPAVWTLTPGARTGTWTLPTRHPDGGPRNFTAYQVTLAGTYYGNYGSNGDQLLVSQHRYLLEVVPSDRIVDGKHVPDAIIRDLDTGEVRNAGLSQSMSPNP